MVDLSARGCGLHAGAKANFHQHAATIPTMCGGWRQFQFLGDRLVWSWVLSDHTSITIRPSTRPGGHVPTVSKASWFPSVPGTLSDQRYADLIALHTALIPIQLSERALDVWEWRGSRFSARIVYHHFQDLESSLDLSMLLKCCRLLWKCRISLKIKLFGWLLLRQRLMTRSLRRRFCPDAPVECPLCAGAAKDCSHLFFECQFAQTV